VSDQLLDRLAHLRTGKVGDHIRPHKPCLLPAVNAVASRHGWDRGDFLDPDSEERVKDLPKLLPPFSINYNPWG
jgi:hypothetical protein